MLNGRRGGALRWSPSDECLADDSFGACKRYKAAEDGKSKQLNADNLAFSYSIIPARAEWGQVKDNEQVMPLLDAAANAINSAHW